MKILQILPELRMGGVERGTVDLARMLIAQGHEALVVSNGGDLVKELESSGARHIRLPVHRKSLFTILYCIPKLARVLKQEKVDIVHARSRVPALIAFLACRRRATIFLSTCHGYYSQNLFSRVMGWGKFMIVASSAIARHMIEDFGVPEQRIKLIPRGVDLQEFKFLGDRQKKEFQPDVFTIGVIGRLSPIKGHKYFLLALAKVIRQLPRIKALIVGDASSGKEGYRDELKMLSRRLSLDKYVEFIPRARNVPKLLYGLDILVLPTVTQEAFGRVLIEAAACGVAVIATKVGGIVDIVEDGKTGILVAPKDPADLASAIIRLYKEPKLAQRLIVAARKNVEYNFSLEQMAQKTINVYQEALSTLRILVIKLGALGDVILAVPSLRAIRQKFPQAEIILLVAKEHQAIIKNCPYVDRVIAVALEKKGYRSLLHSANLLRKMNFDIVLDLQNNRRSHLLAYLSGCNRRYGYDNGKFSFLLNRKVQESTALLSPIKHQARTLKMLGVESIEEQLELWPEESDELWARDFLKAQRKDERSPLVGINLEASAQRPTKRWAVTNIAALLDKLAAEGAEVLLTAKSQDNRLLQYLRQHSQHDFIDAAGKTTIMQLACLIKRCSVYVTGDSAPLHLAYTSGVPVVALFGPTNPQRHTLEYAKQTIIKKDLSCSPCYKRRCKDHRCMDEITADEVFKAVKRSL